MSHALYDRLAEWWPLLSPPADYAPEAAFVLETLRETSTGDVRTLLELGSGGGNTASHLKRDLELTLVDLSPAMLDGSRRLNPECKHVEGDMRDVRLGKTFDAVFVHDALAYALSRDDLGRVIETCRVHCRPGGCVLLLPDCTTETYKAETDCGGVDGDDGRALRFLEWRREPEGETYVVDYALNLTEADGAARTETDSHTCGLFPRAFWLEALEGAGMTASTREFRPATPFGPGPAVEAFVGSVKG